MDTENVVTRARGEEKGVVTGLEGEREQSPPSHSAPSHPKESSQDLLKLSIATLQMLL